LLYSYGKDTRNTQLEVDVDDVWLDADKAVPLGLLITEVVSNSLIHAFPSGEKGTVRVELREAEMDRLALTVSDDGIGFSESDLDRRKSIGLQLVRRLAKQLRGTIEFQPNDGTTVKMVFQR
jgi:two-component sensor histidine kinase